MLVRWVACVGLIVTGFMAGTALAQIQPIVIRPATGHPQCEVYLKADGSRLMFKGKPVAARGTCPPEFLRGTVVRFGAETYRLQIPSESADCVITPQGLGRCR